MSKDLLVVVEHDGEKARRASLEALALARRMAGHLGGRACAAVLGHGVEAVANEVAGKGADEVFLLEHELLASYTPDAYRLPLVELVRDGGFEWVLAGNTYQAQDFLPLVAVAFGAPVVSDAVDVDLGDRVVFHRGVFNGKLVAKTVDDGPAPHFATLQSGAFPADDLPEGHGGTVTRKDVDLSPAQLRRKVLEVIAADDQAVDLTAAEIIVSGGRGLGDKETFESLVGGLAKVLGAAVGASRPVVDNEWLPHEHQVGSSGQTVQPKLYVALAISGAIQHVIGMRGSQVVVAVNRDKDAPIFNEATYGIVGDVKEVVPALIQAIEEAKAR